MGKCDDHCGSHDHEHRHHHHSCADEFESCCEDDCYEDCDSDFAEEMLELADDAWLCLLKDKVKEQILATSGKQLDELAKLISEANCARWKSKMAEEAAVDGFRDELRSFFGKCE